MLVCIQPVTIVSKARHREPSLATVWRSSIKPRRNTQGRRLHTSRNGRAISRVNAAFGVPRRQRAKGSNQNRASPAPFKHRCDSEQQSYYKQLAGLDTGLPRRLRLLATTGLVDNAVAYCRLRAKCCLQGRSSLLAIEPESSRYSRYMQLFLPGHRKEGKTAFALFCSYFIYAAG